MPYAATHKAETRARIVQSARRLFNRHGFTEVSIDEIMSAAGRPRALAREARACHRSCDLKTSQPCR